MEAMVADVQMALTQRADLLLDAQHHLGERRVLWPTVAHRCSSCCFLLLSYVQPFTGLASDRVVVKKRHRALDRGDLVPASQGRRRVRLADGRRDPDVP